jgi:RNA polymerase sigma factor (sigma-70 family)
MLDTGVEGSQKLIARLKEPGMWMRLVWIARWSTRELSRAEDLVQDTIMRVRDPNDLPWDGKRPFLSFMSFMLRHVFCDWMRRRLNLEVPIDAIEVARRTRSDDPSAEDAIEQKRAEERFRALSSRLRSELDAGDPLARQCFSLWESGMCRKEQAATLGCTEERVRALHLLITRRAGRVREAYDADERDRIKALRAAAVAVKADRPSQGAKA